MFLQENQRGELDIFRFFFFFLEATIPGEKKNQILVGKGVCRFLGAGRAIAQSPFCWARGNIVYVARGVDQCVLRIHSNLLTSQGKRQRWCPNSILQE